MLKKIPIEAVKRDDRQREDYGDIEELKLSLQEHGLIQPIAVAENDDGTFDLVAGGRRLMAADLLGWEFIEANAFDRELDKLELKTLELIENTKRKDLSFQEELKAKSELHQLYVEKHGEKRSGSPNDPGWSISDTAELIGVNRGQLSRELELAEEMPNLPFLSKARNKTEALKTFDKFKKRVEGRIAVREIEAENKAGGEERRLTNLCSRYNIGDFLEAIKNVEGGAIKLVEIDPPYAVELPEVKKYASGYKFGVDGYNEISYHEYLPFMDDVLRECYRVMARDSWIILWYGMSRWHVPMWRLLEKHGFEGMPLPAIWSKGRGQANQPDLYLASTYECFFYFRKGNPRMYKPGRANVFNYPVVDARKKIQPTERPIEMMEDVLSTFCGPRAYVMSPFLGSGNTILAADNCHMVAFGWDLNEDYRNSYVLRVKEGLPGPFKSYSEVSK